MYSGDAPPSFSSGGINTFNQEQFQVDAQPWLNQPPSHGSMEHGHGNSLTQLHDGIGHRGLAQSDPMVISDSEKLPSFTALGQGRGISHNHDGMSGNREYGVGGQALSVGAMVKGQFSNPSGSGGDPYGGGTGPGLSDVARRESSQTGGSSGIDLQTSSDPLEYVGMSLVGKNFKKYYPNAYYKEKDEN